MAFCSAFFKWSQSTAEGGPIGLRCGMQEMRGVVRVAEQFPQHPPL